MKPVRTAPVLLALAALTPLAPAADATRVLGGPDTNPNPTFAFENLHSFPNVADQRGLDRYRLRTAWIPATGGVSFPGTRGGTAGPRPLAPHSSGPRFVPFIDPFHAPALPPANPPVATIDGGGVPVPTPSAALAGIFGLGAVAMRRRRRAAAESVA